MAWLAMIYYLFCVGHRSVSEDSICTDFLAALFDGALLYNLFSIFIGRRSELEPARLFARLNNVVDSIENFQESISASAFVALARTPSALTF